MKSVDQKRQALTNYLREHADNFARQGSVRATWRMHQGKKLGPFYLLVHREAGRQRTLYIGADRALADEVQQQLAELQAPLRSERAFDRQLARLHQDFQEQKHVFARHLQQYGLRLKGTEVRGWRSFRRGPDSRAPREG